MNTPLLDGIVKEAGVTSEVIGSILSSPVAIPAGLIGLLAGKRDEGDMDKQEEKSWSNIIPGVGAYRLARRIKTKL